MPVEAKKPYLSVIIPTADRPKLLPRAVTSVLGSDFDDLEVIIVNDGSVPPPSEVLALSHVRAIETPGRKGAATARNIGAEAADGEIILFLDDDDEIEEHYPGRVARIAQDNPRVSWGASAVIIRVPDAPDKPSLARLAQGQQSANQDFRRKLFPASAGLWVRRDAFISVGKFDPTLWIDEDTEFCARMLAAGNEPWYELKPGVTVHRNWVSDGHANQLTSSTDPERTVSCYRRTFDRQSLPLSEYSEASYFLGHRLVRRATALGVPADIWSVVSKLPTKTAKLRLLAYWVWRRLSKRDKSGGS